MKSSKREQRAKDVGGVHRNSRRIASAKRALSAVNAMRGGDVPGLENTRFHKGEERNDPDLVAQLAALGDIFVNTVSASRKAKGPPSPAALIPAAVG